MKGKNHSELRFVEVRFKQTTTGARNIFGKNAQELENKNTGWWFQLMSSSVGMIGMMIIPSWENHPVMFQSPATIDNPEYIDYPYINYILTIY